MSNLPETEELPVSGRELLGLPAGIRALEALEDLEARVTLLEERLTQLEAQRPPKEARA